MREGTDKIPDVVEIRSQALFHSLFLLIQKLFCGWRIANETPASSAPLRSGHPIPTVKYVSTDHNVPEAQRGLQKSRDYAYTAQRFMNTFQRLVVVKLN